MKPAFKRPGRPPAMPEPKRMLKTSVTVELPEPMLEAVRALQEERMEPTLSSTVRTYIYEGLVRLKDLKRVTSKIE